MASTNIYKRFQSLTSNKPQFRATVTEVDSTNSRIKVTYTGYNEWVTGSASVGDHVLIQSGVVLSTLPDLPYITAEV